MSASRWCWPRVLAHRGAGRFAPENTLAALRKGVALGARGLECDVKPSRDSICLLLHDDTLERTTDGHGPASAHDWAALSQLDAGRWHSPEYAGEPPARLAAIAAACRALDHAINVEIKPEPGREAETGRAVASACAHLWAGIDPPPLLSSFSPAALHAARRAAPRLPRGLLVESIPDDWQTQLAALDAIALHCWHESLTPALAAAVKSAGYALFCYTVDDAQRARELFGWGVDGLCTDRPDVVTEALA